MIERPGAEIEFYRPLSVQDACDVIEHNKNIPVDLALQRFKLEQAQEDNQSHGQCEQHQEGGLSGRQLPGRIAGWQRGLALIGHFHVCVHGIEMCGSLWEINRPSLEKEQRSFSL